MIDTNIAFLCELDNNAPNAGAWSDLSEPLFWYSEPVVGAGGTLTYHDPRFSRGAPLFFAYSSLTELHTHSSTLRGGGNLCNPMKHPLQRAILETHERYS